MVLKKNIGRKFEMIYNRSKRQEDVEKLRKVYKRYVFEESIDSETNQRKKWIKLLKEEKINMVNIENLKPGLLLLLFLQFFLFILETV